MPGGARARSGPPPDPNAIRRDRPSDQAGWTDLPERREGPTPEWPLPDETVREQRMWERLWTTPQATEWERRGMQDEVAMYVRTFCVASERDARADIRTLVIRQQETLGLSLPGLARNRWRIAEQQQEAPKTDGRRRTSARDRFAKIVELEERRKPA